LDFLKIHFEISRSRESIRNRFVDNQKYKSTIKERKKIGPALPKPVRSVSL